MAVAGAMSRLDETAEEGSSGETLRQALHSEISWPAALLQLHEAAQERSRELAHAARSTSHRPARAADLRDRALAFTEEARAWLLLWHLSSARDELDHTASRYEDDLTRACPSACRPLRSRIRRAASGPSRSSLNRLNRVVSWLEHSFASDSDTDSDPYLSSTIWQSEGVWHSTLRSCAHDSSLASALDPDGPSRSGMPLERGDTTSETRIMRAVWRLLRAGRPKSARSLCEHAGQHWRSLSLGASLEWSPVPVGAAALDEAKEDASTGNEASLREQVAAEINGFHPVQRMRWKWACAMAAEQAHANGNVMEGAVYGILAGVSSAAIKGVERDWHEELWVHCRCALDNEADRQLHATSGGVFENGMHADDHGAVTLDKDCSGMNIDDVVRWDPREGESEPELANIFDLTGVNGVRHQMGSKRVQRLCELEEYMARPDWSALLEALGRMVQPQSSSSFDVHNLRIAATLLAFLHKQCLPDGEELPSTLAHPSIQKDNILRAYVWRLIDSAQVEIVPLYVRYMQSATIKLTYTQMLEFFVNQDLEHKMRVLKGARMNLPKMDSEGSVDNVLQNFFANLTSLSYMARRNDPTLSFPEQRYHALEWIVADFQRPAAQLVNNAQCIVRDLVLSGNVNLAKTLFESTFEHYHDHFHRHIRKSDAEEAAQWRLYFKCYDLLHRYNILDEQSDAGSANAENAEEIGHQAVEAMLALLYHSEEHGECWMDPDFLHQCDSSEALPVNELTRVEIELVLRWEQSQGSDELPKSAHSHLTTKRYAGKHEFVSIKILDHMDTAVCKARDLILEAEIDGAYTLVYSKCTSVEEKRERDERAARSLLRTRALPPLVIEAAKVEARVSPGHGRIIMSVADDRKGEYQLFTPEQIYALLLAERDSELNHMSSNSC